MELANLSHRRPIVLVINSAEIGGAEKQLVRLAGELKSKGVRVEVIFMLSGGPLTVELDKYSIPWRNFNIQIRAHRFRSLLNVIRMGVFLRKLNPIVINAWLFECAALTLIVSLVFSPGSLRIASFRGNPERVKKGLQILFSKVFRMADGVICNAQHLADGVVSTFNVDPSKIRIIRNGVDIPEHLANVASQPPTAVVVANFHKYKGHSLLLESLALAPPSLNVRLCGGGLERESIGKLIQDLGLENSVTLVSEPANVANEIAQAQFAIHPSMTEGMSNAILEEISVGLPVVAFDIPGNDSLVIDNVTGLLVKPGDAKELAKAITYLASDPGTRSRMSLKARDHAKNFDWDSCSRNYENYLSDLIENKKYPRKLL